MNKIQSQPLISVLLPVYNAELFLKEAIDSVLDQTYANFELIIINDGSVDGSENIIFSFDDKRIRYVKNDENLGITKTLNKGISLAQGKYIARMDADDICLPCRLMKQFLFLEQHQDIGLCGTWIDTINERNEITGKVINQTKPEFIKIHLLFSTPIAHPSVFARAELLKENLYDDVLFAEDYDLWCRLSTKSKLANIPEFLLYYRWHNSNISQEKVELQQANKSRITKNELASLNIYPTERELYLHTLSFSLYFHGKEKLHEVSSKDMLDVQHWFEHLITSNKKCLIYEKSAFAAFLWCRWIVLCVYTKKYKKIFMPSFASYQPKILYNLIGQLNLSRKK